MRSLRILRPEEDLDVNRQGFHHLAIEARRRNRSYCGGFLPRDSASVIVDGQALLSSDPSPEASHEVFTPTLTSLGERAHLLSPEINLDTHIRDIMEVLWRRSYKARH